MRRPIVFISLALSLTLAVSLIVGWAATRKTTPTPTPKAQYNPVAQSQGVSLQMMYSIMFRHIALLNRKAEEAERQGRDGAAFRLHYKTLANLTEREGRILNRVALETNEKVEAIDAKAKKIIDAVRAQTPNGILQPGQSTPEPPPQLKTMQKERDDMILAGIAKLHSGLEPARAAHFAQFVALKIEPSFKNLITPDSMPPRPRQLTQQELQDARRSK